MSNWSSGTNTIKEVDTNKNLTLQMLKLKKQGGGTEYFVRKSDVTLGTKSVTQNGTYTAASDGKYGFSQFSVNVRGGNGSADNHGKPTGGDIKPGGAGSAVVGTDPETGNDVVVGVDEDGQLVNTPLPSSIVLVTNPTKMDYNDGETIDLSGAVVVAKNADGTTWTDVDHPNGHVSCSCDPAVADASQASGASATSSLVGVPISFGSPPTYYWYDSYVPPRGFYLDGGTAATFWRLDTNGLTNRCVASAEPFTAVTYEIWADGSRKNEHSHSAYSYTFDGKTVYYYSRYSRMGNAHFDPVINESVITASAGAVAWTIIYGNITTAGTQEITLNWARPGDGKLLSTTMEITGHAASSSSGDNEGGGAGHSF